MNSLLLPKVNNRLPKRTLTTFPLGLGLHSIAFHSGPRFLSISFPLFASILHDSPFAQLCASLRVLHSVTPLRVMRMSTQSFRSLHCEGETPSQRSKHRPKRSKEDAGTKTNNPNGRHSEVVGIARGSSQQARPDHGRIQRVLELQRRKSNSRAHSMPIARHTARPDQYVSEVADVRPSR